MAPDDHGSRVNCFGGLAEDGGWQLRNDISYLFSFLFLVFIFDAGISEMRVTVNMSLRWSINPYGNILRGRRT